MGSALDDLNKSWRGEGSERDFDFDSDADDGFDEDFDDGLDEDLEGDPDDRDDPDDHFDEDLDVAVFSRGFLGCWSSGTGATRGRT